ncbi:MAG: DUF2071 domain-containing protein [Bacteroidota bacterium]
MFSFLKNHPFAVEAFFESSTVLTFAVPKEQLQSMIPPCLSLDTYNDQWAFIAVAMVQTKNLRPKGFPAFLGNDFFLTGYRIFVRYTNTAGKNLRGLYIIKSETDKLKMQFLGNIFTHYNYSTTDISVDKSKKFTTIRSEQSAFSVKINTNEESTALPLGSPFDDWKQARRFAGPLPFTFTYEPEKRRVLIIEGVRQNWLPKPISVLSHQFAFLDGLNLPGLVLANAFIINSIPYWWKSGKTEIWPL